ncbi:MAG TPA: UvrD-helicase domain-containing protein [Chloroflexota bacterium]|nr:UvrD-helicase domain-containing protein [Chloroflexota bacterium]
MEARTAPQTSTSPLEAERPALGGTNASSPDVGLSSDVEAFLAQHLNPAQREAVVAPDGPLLILAGAGSGKTRVIAYRVAYLVKERSVAPSRIMAVTFTNKAAGEMKQRVEGLIGPAARSAMMGTFHSICARLLRRSIGHIGYEPSFSIYDEADQLGVLKRCYAEAGISQKQYAPGAVRAAISRAKENLLTPAQYSQQADDPFTHVVSALYRRYQEALQDQNALDFDDLLVHMLRVFEAAPEVLSRLQESYDHVLVDEYQDVNKAQYLLVRALAARHRNLTIVGDDSQAIYGWRGANVRYILAFEEDFPECRVVRLEQNYRSTKTILAAAQAVEAGLRLRREKTLWTENAQGVPITICHAADEHDEALFIAREVERLVSQEYAPGDDAGARRPYRYRDVAVMYRTNAQSRALEEAFVRRRVPYQLVGGTRFYERREIKDILAYLRLIHNPADGASLERIINVPSRGLGEKSLDDLRTWASRLGIPVAHALSLLRLVDEAEAQGREAPAVPPPFAPRAKAQLLAFTRMIEELREEATQVDIVKLFESVIRRTGYREYLAEDKSGEERWENVKELGTVVAQFSGLAAGSGLSAFLEEVSLLSDIDTMKEEVDQVTLMTLHAAKGLEFPVVFVPGMEEGILPHARALEAVDEVEFDEERRLAYVGITRAMQRLYLVCCQQRTLFGFTRQNEPSRFLAELPTEHLRWVNSFGVDAGPGGGLASGFGGSALGGSTFVRSWGGGATAVGSWSSAPLTSQPAQPALAKERGSQGEQGSVTPKYKAGDRVRHTAFGEGVVLESTVGRRGEEEVRVRFHDSKERLLLGAMAPMEVLD